MMVVRHQKVLTAEEAGILREEDHVYLLAPPERALELDRFLLDLPITAVPNPAALVDFPGAGRCLDRQVLAEMVWQTVTPRKRRSPWMATSAQRGFGCDHISKGDIVPLADAQTRRQSGLDGQGDFGRRAAR